MNKKPFLWWIWAKSIKTFWKGVKILDTIKYICDSWEVTHDISSNRSWEESTLMGNFEGLNSSVEEVTAYGVEIAWELELEAWKCD